MKHLLIEKRFFLLAFTAVAMLFCQRLVAQVVIIACPKVSVAEISKGDLRDVFTGTSSTIKGGAHVVPVLLKEGPTHDEMLTLFIGKSDSAFRATWRSLIFSGQGAMPRSLDSEAAVVDFVAHTPGAIGYIGKATPHEGVKVLSVH